MRISQTLGSKEQGAVGCWGGAQVCNFTVRIVGSQRAEGIWLGKKTQTATTGQ